MAVSDANHLSVGPDHHRLAHTVAMPFNFTRLIWAALIGWAVFAELPDAWTWFGGAIICVASVWLTRIVAPRRAGNSEDA
jgi:drug/metabolite transporter (DMT)-like permease